MNVWLRFGLRVFEDVFCGTEVLGLVPVSEKNRICRGNKYEKGIFYL